MPKKKSGPSGPDQNREPREIAPSDAAPDQPVAESAVADNTEYPGDAQSRVCLPEADPGDTQSRVCLPEADCLYDSGWEDCSGTLVRVVFTAGPSSPPLRNWVRELMLLHSRAGS